MSLITIDVWPRQDWCVRIKLPVAQFMDRIGLRQGSWAMFTPNPVLNNRWVSARMQTKDGRTLNWDSPIWSRATTWDKFVQFRSINYYNRIHQPWYLTGGKDYMEHLIRTSDEPIESIQLYLNRMDLIMPEDGSFPPRDEATWSLTSEPWLSKSLTP